MNLLPTRSSYYLLAGCFGIGAMVWGVQLAAAAAHDTAWALPEWQYRQRLDIRFSETVTEAATDVPLHVRITGDEYELFRLADATGADVRFVDPTDGAVLPYSIETYNAAEAELAVWVRVPQVLPGDTHQLDIYFASRAEDLVSAPHEVWTGFDGVFLMQDGPAQLAIRNAALPDTPASYTTTRGNARFTQGITGSAIQFDGATTVIDVDGASGSSRIETLPPLTLAAWVKPQRLAGTIISQRDTQHTQWQLFSDSAGRLRLREDVTGRWPQHDTAGTRETALRLNEWQFVGVSIDEEGVPTFFNNSTHETAATAGGTFVQRTIATAIGGRWSFYPRSTYLFRGEIDSVWVAPRVLSAAYLNAMRLGTQAHMTVGTLEEQESEAVIPATPVSPALAVITTPLKEIFTPSPVMLFAVSVVGILLIFLRVSLGLWRRQRRVFLAKRPRPPGLVATRTLDIHTD